MIDLTDEAAPERTEASVSATEIQCLDVQHQLLQQAFQEVLQLSTQCNFAMMNMVDQPQTAIPLLIDARAILERAITLLDRRELALVRHVGSA